MFAGADAPWHWAILIVLVIALFGYKKLPDAARSVGRSLRVFKTEMKGLSADDAARDSASTTPVAPEAPAVSGTNLAKAVPPAEVSSVSPTATAAQPVSQPQVSSAGPASQSDAGSTTTPGTV
jgi:sec-independent protein translocase protein TatA